MFQAGKHPPTFVPFCGLCDLPVERFSYRVPKHDTWVVEFDAQCCGKTQGKRITIGEMYRLNQTGEKLYLIVRRGLAQQVKAQARR